MSSYARNRNAVWVGALAIVAAVVFTVLFASLTDRALAWRRPDVYVRLPTAERLKKGDPVLFRGVPVGEVRSIDFARDGGVVVHARLRKTVPLTDDASVSLEAVDVFGSMSVVLHAGSPAAPALVAGDTLAGRAPRSLAASAEVLGDRARRLLDDTAIALVHGTLTGGARAADALQHLIADADATLGAERASLSVAAANSAALASNLRGATDGPELKETIANLQQITAALATVTREMNGAASSLSSTLAKLDRGAGTAGRMLNDPALYERALAAVDSLNALTSDLKAHPGRYLHVSVF